MIDELKITSLNGRGTLFMKRNDYQGYWLGPVDWGQVEGTHQTYNYYNQVGVSIVSTTVLPRPMSITGWVVDAGDGTLQERCDYLNSFLSPVEDYELEYKGKKIRFRPDISVAYIHTELRNNQWVRRFLIEATCPYPLFSDAEDTAMLFDQTKRLFRFPTDFGQEKPLVFADTSQAFAIDVYNKGGFSTGIIIRIRFTGDVSSPRIKNMTIDQMIGVTYTFHRGETLEISTIPGSKKMMLYRNGVEAENMIKYRDTRTRWIQLQPGENQISLDCDDLEQRANMDVTLYFTPLYLEVE